MNKKILLLLLGVLINILSVNAYVNISSCVTIDSTFISNNGGELEYKLNQSIHNYTIGFSQACIFLNGNDIILDCQNNSIIGGNNSNSVSIRLDFFDDGITVRNCRTQGFDILEINTLSNTVIENNIFNDDLDIQSLGINSFIRNNQVDSFSVMSNTGGVTFINNTGSFGGFSLSNQNYFYDNYFTSFNFGFNNIEGQVFINNTIFGIAGELKNNNFTNNYLDSIALLENSTNNLILNNTIEKIAFIDITVDSSIPNNNNFTNNIIGNITFTNTDMDGVSPQYFNNNTYHPSLINSSGCIFDSSVCDLNFNILDIIITTNNTPNSLFPFGSVLVSFILILFYFS